MYFLALCQAVGSLGMMYLAGLSALVATQAACLGLIWRRGEMQVPASVRGLLISMFGLERRSVSVAC